MLHPSYEASKHLHNVEMRFYCPQMFLRLDFQRVDDISELRKTFHHLKRADSHEKLAKERLCSESMLHHVGNRSRSNNTVCTMMLLPSLSRRG